MKSFFILRLMVAASAWGTAMVQPVINRLFPVQCGGRHVARGDNGMNA